MESRETIVRARGLTKKFGARVAVDGIDFDVNAGEIVGFLGPNGAGKTTTIRMLLNILRPTSGELTIFGNTFRHHRASILRDMNASSGTLTLPGKLSVIENLLVFADLYELRDARPRIDTLIEKFDLRELKDRSLYSLSTGQQVRVSLAKAFLNRPRLLLLDEPTSSLDPEVADRVRSFLMDLVSQEGTTVFLTSHNMAEVEEVCTRVLFLNEGRIQAEGSPQDLARRLRWRRIAVTTKQPIAQLPPTGVDMGDVVIEGATHTATIDRDSVGKFVTSLVQHGVEIANLSIQEPTLEDFFVHSARKGDGDE